MHKLPDIVENYWGYDSFLPLQQEAMGCVMNGRDSVVVLPTGGGKSLCFQAPAMALEGMAVVVSPLISLMKDQVDQLKACGVPAACINSAMAGSEKQAVHREIQERRLRLLYVSPERIVQPNFVQYLRKAHVSFLVVDEAHCISQWGHDFRPEYRELSVLRDEFEGLHIHAYTATATEHVRQDIARQLHLRNPEVLVGSFDRPNLVYRVQPAMDKSGQVRNIIGRYPGESGIIYCIRRKDVDALCTELRAAGYEARPYHAGMEDSARKRNQEAFIHGQADIIVATIAFGMGIDKPDVRYVIHAGMPKSVEHYQQESGRAGRDGLEAECHLLYSGGDYGVWKFFIDKMEDEDAAKIARRKLSDVYNYCTGVVCRHKSLVSYFAGTYTKDNCGACDVCLSELDMAEDSTQTTGTILACVSEIGEYAGPSYTTMVLIGSRDARVLSKGHERLGTHGALASESKHTVRDWIEQLVAQGYLEKTGEYNLLRATAKGRGAAGQTAWERIQSMLRVTVKGRGAAGQTPTLAKAARKPAKKSAAFVGSWDGVDKGLVDVLRTLRSDKAAERAIPAYAVFSDASLRDMARRRPTDTVGFLAVHGVGEKKCGDYGEEFLAAIREYCEAHSVGMDVAPAGKPLAKTAKPRPLGKRGAAQRHANVLFEQGHSPADVAEAVGRTLSTVEGYLEQYIESNGITDPAPWADCDVFERVREAAATADGNRLKPIHDLLDGEVCYAEIRACLACIRNGG